MIAQALLSLLLCGVLMYAWVEYRRSPVVAILSVVASLAGLYFVWLPSQTTRIAEFVGVGRGADLVLYLWICISLIVLLNLHLKLRRQQEMLTKLARTIAIANASVAPTAADGPELKAPLTPVKDLAAAAPARTSRQMRDQTV